MHAFQVKQSNHLDVLRHYIGLTIKKSWTENNENFEKNLQKAKEILKNYCQLSDDFKNLFLAVDSCRKEKNVLIKKELENI